MGIAYDSAVKGLLDFSERMFGDKGQPAPGWTAASFVRCLLFAAVYPVVSLALIWTVTGQVGIAEAAMGLANDAAWYVRILLPAGWLPIIFWLIWRSGRNPARRDDWREAIVFLAATAVAFGAAVAVAGAGALAGAAAVALAGVAAGVGALTYAYAFAVVGAATFAGFFAFAVVVAFAAAAAGAVVGVGALVLFAAAWIASPVLPSRFRGLLAVIGLAALPLIFLPHFYDFSDTSWPESAAFALFLPLMTLVNAPADWLSLGITRKLLRRGLGKANWQPLLWSALDIVLALACLTALGAAMILVIQTFNARLITEGGAAIYDPGAVLRALADPAQRWKPQYWWIYATLFSTFIPSFLNLLVGSVAIVRGITPITSWTLKKLPQNAAITPLWLFMMPPVLAGLRTFTIILAAGALGGLVYLLAAVILPLFGLGLLDILTVLADADWPAQLLLA